MQISVQTVVQMEVNEQANDRAHSYRGLEPSLSRGLPTGVHI